jgi:hypothetical protein
MVELRLSGHEGQGPYTLTVGQSYTLEEDFIPSASAALSEITTVKTWPKTGPFAGQVPPAGQAHGRRHRGAVSHPRRPAIGRQAAN